MDDSWFGIGASLNKTHSAPEVTRGTDPGVTALTLPKKTLKVLPASRYGHTAQTRQTKMHHIRHLVVTLAHRSNMSKVGGTLA